MKTYNFTVEVEGIHSNESSLINSFINIANDEQNQLKITESINKKSTKIYNKILFDFVEKINIELSIAHIIGFEKPYKYRSFSNLCFGSLSKAFIDNGYFDIEIVPIKNKDFKDSKYTTYTGDYWIKMNGKLVKTVDEVLEYLKAEIINTIKNQ